MSYSPHAPEDWMKARDLKPLAFPDWRTGTRRKRHFLSHTSHQSNKCKVSFGCRRSTKFFANPNSAIVATPPRVRRRYDASAVKHICAYVYVTQQHPAQPYLLRTLFTYVYSIVIKSCVWHRLTASRYWRLRELKVVGIGVTLVPRDSCVVRRTDKDSRHYLSC